MADLFYKIPTEKDKQEAVKEGFENIQDYYNERANRILAKRAKLKVIKVDRELAEYLRDIYEANMNEEKQT